MMDGLARGQDATKMKDSYTDILLQIKGVKKVAAPQTPSVDREAAAGNSVEDKAEESKSAEVSKSSLETDEGPTVTFADYERLMQRLEKEQNYDEILK